MSVNKLPFYVPDGIIFGDSTIQISAYSNANVATFLPTYTGGFPSLTGSVITVANISGNNVIGNGSFLTAINGGNVTGQVANALVSGTVYANAQPNITSVGTLANLTVGDYVSAGGNVQGANIVIQGGAHSNLFIGGTPFVRTLTVPTRTVPVTVPMASNNTFNVLLAHGGNAVVYTT